MHDSLLIWEFKPHPQPSFAARWLFLPARQNRYPFWVLTIGVQHEVACIAVRTLERLCCKNYVEGGDDVKRFLLVRSGCHSKQLGNQGKLTSHISFFHSLQLSFSGHAEIHPGTPMRRYLAAGGASERQRDGRHISSAERQDVVPYLSTRRAYS